MNVIANDRCAFYCMFKKYTVLKDSMTKLETKDTY